MMLLNKMDRNVDVGDRVEYLGHIGTVKYLGEVEGYTGEWLGIDWDDPNRGKHNGTVNGRLYFSTRFPKSGSFIRLEKVDCGQSAAQALISRYGQKEDTTMSQAHKQQLLSLQQSINAPFLEMVGFEKVFNKQKDFNNLKIVNLRMQNVNRHGEPHELGTLCPNITELDLSRNLFKNWTSIFALCDQLDHLKWLNVSENVLVLNDDYRSYTFTNLRVLICGHMHLEWKDILPLHQVFPNCEEVRMPFNNITSFTIPQEEEERIWQMLKLLDLEGNPIKEWSEICKLSTLVELEHLNIENVGLKRISFGGSSNEKTVLFRNLKKLVLSNNLINDWQSVGELNKLERLEDLRFLKNPLFETETYATCVQLIVARIGNLKMLNGAVIKPDERKGAEYDYVKKYGIEWLSVRNDLEKQKEFLEKYNRYDELVKTYGTPEESELTVQSNLIEKGLIELEIIYNESRIKKKLPPTIVIQKLALLIQRIFRMSEKPVLSYVSHSEPAIEILLEDETKEINFYSIEHGDCIIVRT